jgi:hypothetical protein
LATGTSPLVSIGLLVGDFRSGLNGPLFDAVQVKDVKTARALPDGLVTPDILITDHTFTLVLSELFGEDLGTSLVLRWRCVLVRPGTVDSISRGCFLLCVVALL